MFPSIEAEHPCLQVQKAKAKCEPETFLEPRSYHKFMNAVLGKGCKVRFKSSTFPPLPEEWDLCLPYFSILRNPFHTYSVTPRNYYFTPLNSTHVPSILQEKIFKDHLHDPTGSQHSSMCSKHCKASLSLATGWPNLEIGKSLEPPRESC